MSKRLQVLVDEKEYQQLMKTSQDLGITASEFVRNSFRESLKQFSKIEPETKLRAIEKALTYSFPTGDIDPMLEEIKKGYEEL